MFVGEITNVYLDRGEQTLTAAISPLPRADETHAQTMRCAFAPRINSGTAQKSQHVGGTWHHASLGNCGAEAVNAS